MAYTPTLYLYQVDVSPKKAENHSQPSGCLGQWGKCQRFICPSTDGEIFPGPECWCKLAHRWCHSSFPLTDQVGWGVFLVFLGRFPNSHKHALSLAATQKASRCYRTLGRLI